MNPESEYLRWLFYEGEGRTTRRVLPPKLEFHMMFGFRMRNASSTANDGSVSVTSQARLEAQEQAVTIRAFDHGHVEILRSEEAVARVNRLLAGRFR